MSDDERSGSNDPGIFGSLPSSRPGSRSPRRSGGEGAGKSKGSQTRTASRPSAAKAESSPSASTASAPPPPRPHERHTGQGAGQSPPGPKEGDGQTGIEDLAWAGVAAAAEAATLGVRLATRALETVRRAAER
jgi:hypothetical protein